MRVNVIVSKTGIGLASLGVLIYIVGIGINLLYPVPTYTGDMDPYLADFQSYEDAIAIAGWLAIIGFLLFAFATLLTIYFLKAEIREARSLHRREDIHPVAVTKTCPKCNSTNTTVYHDGSGICRTCGLAFRRENG